MHPLIPQAIGILAVALFLLQKAPLFLTLF